MFALQHTCLLSSSLGSDVSWSWFPIILHENCSLRLLPLVTRQGVPGRHYGEVMGPCKPTIGPLPVFECFPVCLSNIKEQLQPVPWKQILLLFTLHCIHLHRVNHFFLIAFIQVVSESPSGKGTWNVPRPDGSLCNDFMFFDMSFNLLCINFCNIRCLGSSFQSVDHHLFSS